MEKIPQAVKPFLPQLQRTFARGLADTTSETLRNRAAKGLGILITLTPRVDPLVAGKSEPRILTIKHADLWIQSLSLEPKLLMKELRTP